MEIIVNKDYKAMSYACAAFIADYINNNPGKLLCLAAGDTPLGALKELVSMNNKGLVDLSSMFYVSLDEWVGLGREDKGSCLQVMDDNFYSLTNIPKERWVKFNGKADTEKETEKVLSFIDFHGGIGLSLLGVGMNGHVGFNEPGTPANFKGGRVTLSKTSTEVGQKYFDSPTKLAYGVTIGLKYLTESEKVLLIANGEKKAEIIASTLSAKNDINIPSSFFKGENSYIFLDEAAYGNK